MITGRARRVLVWATLSLAGATSHATPADVDATPVAAQLDFLAGEWSLHDAGGAQIGRSTIVLQVPGTMLFEKRRIGEREAQALWLVNAEKHNGWTQLFVGPAGQVREFPPQSAPGDWPLVMGSDVTLRDGSPAKFRMTLSRASDDETRRVLEISRDDGATWSVVLDYTYRRRENDTGSD